MRKCAVCAFDPHEIGYGRKMDRITFNVNQCGGRPCIRGLRVRVSDILELLAANVAEADILLDMPYLEPDDIRACLAYAAEAANHPVLVTEAA